MVKFIMSYLEMLLVFTFSAFTGLYGNMSSMIFTMECIQGKRKVR